MRTHLSAAVLLAVGVFGAWWAYWNVPGPRVVAIGGSETQQAEFWAAVDMFDEAGLVMPAAAVRFSEDPADCGRYGRGRAHETWPRHVVWICTDRRMTIVHELAHVWTYSALDEGERSAWSEYSGASAWRGPRLEWAERGSERAAEVVMWKVLVGEWVPRTGPVEEDRLVADWEWMAAAAGSRRPSS